MNDHQQKLVVSSRMNIRERGPKDLRAIVARSFGPCSLLPNAERQISSYCAGGSPAGGSFPVTGLGAGGALAQEGCWAETPGCWSETPASAE